MIKAIIFDFDGLILDTETPEYHSFQAVYHEHGCHLDLEVWGKCVGTHSGFNPYDFLEESIGRKIDKAVVRQKRRDIYEELMRTQSTRPGVVQYIKRAKELGIKVGLASSSSREWVIGYLTKLNLLEEFDCIRVREDVIKVKPDPELYQQVLDYFQVEPHHAIAFEDSPNGALAAKRAGAFCVVIPNNITKGFKFDEVDLRLESMADKTLDEVFELVISNHTIS